MIRSVIAACVFAASAASASPLASVVRGGVSITLYDEPCVLAEIANLPYRAEWIEQGGKKFLGCWALSRAGQVVLYFDDQTVLAIPMEAFLRVVGT